MGQGDRGPGRHSASLSIPVIHAIDSYSQFGVQFEVSFFAVFYISFFDSSVRLLVVILSLTLVSYYVTDLIAYQSIVRTLPMRRLR